MVNWRPLKPFGTLWKVQVYLLYLKKENQIDQLHGVLFFGIFGAENLNGDQLSHNRISEILGAQETSSARNTTTSLEPGKI